MSRKALVPVSHLSASADPSTPTLRAGDTYANSTSKALRTYDGAAWHEHDTLDLATTSSGAKTFTGGVVVNTTGITGNKEINLTGTGASSVAGTLQGTALIAAGLTGSTAASRYVGATASGAPSTGAHNVGDWVVSQSGAIYVCTVAGTPGTWVAAATNSPVSSVAGRTGAVTLTAADIGAGTFPGANSYSGLQTFNAGLAAGTLSLIAGTRSTTTNAADTVNLGTFATTAGTMELRLHAHLVSGAAGATASVTKVYEMVLNNAMGTLNTWYLCYPSDASANAAATNDFALEVQRTSGTTFSFRFRQKSIGASGTITWTAETLGDTAVTFTPSTTVTAAPAAVSTMHPSNPHVEAAGQVGIGTESPAAPLDVAGTTRAVQFTPTGATGATAASAYIGGTASGAPTTGAHAVGDFVIDQTGGVWVCTASGTPGTWIRAGGSGAWTSYTPTIGGTGWALGDGTIVGSYARIGRTIHYQVAIVWGSTSTFGSAGLTVTVPVQRITSALNPATGTARPNDASASTGYSGMAVVGSAATTATVWAVSSAAGALAAVISTVPFVWASGDSVAITGTYEAATD